MSLIILSVPNHGPIAGAAPEIVTPELDARDLSWYRISTSKENEAQKRLVLVNLNTRWEVWMSQDLRIYSNSEFVYSIS